MSATWPSSRPSTPVTGDPTTSCQNAWPGASSAWQSTATSRYASRRRSAAVRSRTSRNPIRQPGPSSIGAALSTVSGVSLPSRYSTTPGANRSSGRSVRTSTRTSPRRPWTPRTRPTTSRVGPAACEPGSEDLERDRATFAGGRDLQQGAQRLGDAAVPTDDLAHVVLGDMQLDDGPVLLLDLGDLHRVGVVDERAGDVLDQVLRSHRRPTFPRA